MDVCTSFEVMFSRSFCIMISLKRVFMSLSVRSLSVGLYTLNPKLWNYEKCWMFHQMHKICINNLLYHNCIN